MPDGRSHSLQLRIGLFVIFSLGVFLGIIYLLGAQARYFERKYDLVAEFTEVGGLIEGATVRLAGVQIGRVTSVVLPPTPGGKVRVTLTVARRFSDRIRKNSEARIVTQGLLGDRLVEITMGAPDAPPLKPGEPLTSREPFEVGRVFAEG
ncbi:MAG: MlaD family protein, partial [candidate division NC10 bacterium]